MNGKVLSQAKRTVLARRTQAQQRAEDNLYSLLAQPDFLTNYNNIQEQILVVARSYATKTGQREQQAILDNLRISQEQIICNYGYDKGALTPQYHCALCQDTGMYQGQQCKCVSAEVVKLLSQQSNIIYPQYTFSASTDTVNTLAYAKSASWCDKYPTVTHKNILICGMTGVGKTYLASCIVNKLISLQQEVLFITAYDLNKQFLRIHLADIADKQILTEAMENIPVLVIDDLGSEQMYNNVTEEYLFALFNQRLYHNLSTIVSTNLTPKSILTRYGERIFTRIAGKSNTLMLELVGKDKRLNK
ncbi:MAG: ATP-binding protein [Clostridia bacterium]|nr:ATP-binding protein [Clostridia bacterium]